MTESRFLHGLKFIEALIAKGIVPTSTYRLTIRAGADNVVRLEYETYATEDLLATVQAVELEPEAG